MNSKFSWLQVKFIRLSRASLLLMIYLMGCASQELTNALKEHPIENSSQSSNSEPSDSIIGITLRQETDNHKPLKIQFRLSELIGVLKTYKISLKNPAYDDKKGIKTYLGFKFKDILTHIGEKYPNQRSDFKSEDYNVSIRSSDGFLFEVTSADFNQKIEGSELTLSGGLNVNRDQFSEAFLVWTEIEGSKHDQGLDLYKDPKSKSEIDLVKYVKAPFWSEIQGHGKNLGPFYLIWNTRRTYSQKWPFKITDLKLISTKIIKQTEKLKPKFDSNVSVDFQNSINSGFRLVVENCMSCHQVGQFGDARLGPDLKSVSNRPFELFRGKIRAGGERMIRFPASELSDEGIRSIYQFLNYTN